MGWSTVDMAYRRDLEFEDGSSMHIDDVLRFPMSTCACTVTAFESQCADMVSCKGGGS